MRIPRSYDRAIKSMQTIEELNRWATRVDLALIDILRSLGEGSRELAGILNVTNPNLPKHATTHSQTGSDPLVVAAPAFTFGTTAADGSGAAYVRSDSQIALFDSTVPAYRAGTGATGSAGKAARRDHVHPCDYYVATLSANQTSNKAAGDHVMWNGGSGSGITLDTSTAYTSAAGASIGRFTLTGGKVYALMAAMLIEASGAGNYGQFQWSDDSGNVVGAPAMIYPVTRIAAADSTQPVAVAFVAPVSDTRYELRIGGISGITTMYATGSWARVQTI